MHMTEVLIAPSPCVDILRPWGHANYRHQPYLPEDAVIISKLVPMSQTKKYMPKCQNFHDNMPPVMT